MPKSIAVFGAGPGLGRALARRYAQEGYDVVLVARSQQGLDVFAKDLSGLGVSAHVITADLADTAGVPALGERIRAAILTAQGASTLHGLPNMSGSGPAQAAQRNYLQSLHTEVADKGVYVGMLYIGAVIENSAFHTFTVESDAAGTGRYWGPTVSPDHLADLLWNMHSTKGESEAKYPE